MTFLQSVSRWQRCIGYGRVWLRNSSRFSKDRISEEAHATKTLYLWKKISLFGAVPGVTYLAWRMFVSNPEHLEHRDYHPWPHLRIRNKPFPWGNGDKSLFHNPHTNPVPDSGEEEEEIVEEKPSLKSRVDVLWQKYLLDDPVKRDEMRDAHLAKMQKRYEDYQEKKKMPENPIQPLREHLQKNWRKEPVNKVESIQNLA